MCANVGEVVNPRYSDSYHISYTGVTHVPALSFCLRDSKTLRETFLSTFGVRS